MQHMTILVADEHEALANVICGFLERNDFQAIPAFNLQDSWLVLAQRRIDAVILDTQDPGSMGTELLGQLRSSERAGFLPVLILSACVDPDQLWLTRKRSWEGSPHVPPDLSLLLLNLQSIFRKPKEPPDTDSHDRPDSKTSQ
ncbi:MAG: PleD family two-component system response regulator [Terriglobia bacterium]